MAVVIGRKRFSFSFLVLPLLSDVGDNDDDNHRNHTNKRGLQSSTPATLVPLWQRNWIVLIRAAVA